MKTDFKVIVIGSGFGGAVTAFRCTAAGHETLVLERGRRWRSAEFPANSAAPGKKAAFRSNRHPLVPGLPAGANRRFPGLLERFDHRHRGVDVGRQIDVVVGAAYGGGSVVYGAMMVQPEPDLFATIFAPEQIPWATIRSRYRRVAGRIGLEHPRQTAPSVLSDPHYRAAKVFDEQAGRAGFGSNTRRVLTAFDWKIVEAELAGQSPRAACRGEYLFGCRSGAKKSLDKNYLHAAEQTGNLTVKTTTIVDRIVWETSGAKAGNYRIDCTFIGANGDKSTKVRYWARYLFLCAGSMHTTRMLVQARAKGDLPGLTARVGTKWGDNGDYVVRRRMIGERTGIRPGSGRQGGATATSLLLSDRNQPTETLRIMHTPGPDVGAARSLIQLGMVIPKRLGKMTWDGSRVKLAWPGNSGPRNKTRQVLERINAANRGVLDELQDGATFHPLGGAVLGHATNAYGRLRERMYVVDGSLLPGHAGTCNPAWTVAAVAEYCLDQILDPANGELC